MRRARPIVTDEFKFLQTVAKNRVKVDADAVDMHVGQLKDAVDRTVYPDIETYWNDMVAVFQQEIKELYAAGCRMQLDEVPLALLCDNNIRALAKNEGDDPNKLVALHRRAECAVAGRPADLTIGMHLCRGNLESLWVGDGGYAPIAEACLRAPTSMRFCLSMILGVPETSRRCAIYPPTSVPISALSAPRNRTWKGPTICCIGSTMPHVRADGSARHLPAMRLRECGDVQVRCAAEQGDDRYSNAQDRALGRSRPPRLGSCMSAALASDLK